MFFPNPQERPYKLPALCEEVNISIHEIQLDCVYCERRLYRCEVYDFIFRDLCVVYRKGKPLGVCQPCLLFYSKVRQYRRYNQSVYGPTLENLTNKQLCNISIRCGKCQKPLCPLEKQRHVDENKRFHQIADQWTGRCTQCWRPSATAV
ncbi:E6 protein [Alphapapillomavirus 11]|uniref:Protein E6 n=1 Tax=Human papillomavirus type 34 TaxID=333764 RepID=A0A0P0E3K5_HPV34|nr:early protein E6 [Human papillomavirus type 34]WBM83474.1 E6 protein [Alphapapillomavirus 11]ALJ32478.1 early protein E6 [Human papillomavirus type 34]ALJ32485.1 early protein E6 [Human papillomavirus type 34]ALJ32492.1 early protein E6 [Human papillomavirus type 34]